MKISKVKDIHGKFTINAKTAVIVEKDGQEGVLYDDPARQGKGRKSDEQRENYINGRIKSSRRLYSVLSESKEANKKPKTDAEKALNMLIRAFNDKKGAKLQNICDQNDGIFEKYAVKSYENRIARIPASPEFIGLDAKLDPDNVKKLNKAVSVDYFIALIKAGAETSRDKVKIQEADIDAVIRLLKKSLNRDKCKKALKALLMKAFDIVGELDPDIDIRRDFIDLALEDYYRVRVKGRVADSIKRKNMPVQPQKIGDKSVFGVSGIKDGKNKKGSKADERAAFNRFLSDYADLDENKRREMRIRLRRLLDLYFYGKEEAQKLEISANADAWTDHAEHGNNKKKFIEVEAIAKSGDRTADKLALKIREENIRIKYRDKNIECYRYAVKEAEEAPELFFADPALNKFFIHRIESGVERVYTHIINDEDYKLETGYVSEKVWKDLINYISVKYIAIGKAVYNYAMDEMTGKDKEIELGKINAAYISGICSFDYEFIKAEEMLQRERAVYVAFAARHLSHQILELDKKNSDFLLLKDNEIRDFIKKGIDVRTLILQYFGGKSKWSGFSFDKYLTDGRDDADLLCDLKKIIYSMRNDTFHYTTENHDTGSWNMDLITAMFEYETDQVVMIQKDKFYSNNLPMFYKEDDLKKLLSELYGKNVERASQVPAFNSVFVRKNFTEAVKELGIDVSGMETDDRLIYYNALYYMFKEIYYNAFLQDESVLKRFIDMSSATAKTYDRNKAMELRRSGKKEDAKQYEAENDFGARILTIDQSGKGFDLSQICQLIMTEYNQQNTGNMRRKSTDSSKRNPDTYKHYKLLLLLNLRKTFERFVKEKYGFIFTPVKRELGDKDSFIPDFNEITKPYMELTDKLRKSAELQKWYIVGRFLSPKQANQMLGSLHSYKQYVWDIYRRADEVGAKIDRRVSRTKLGDVAISDIDAVLNMCVKMSGTTSNELTDYFKDEEEFAAYIRNYLKFDHKDGEYEWSLKNFCQENAVDENRVGIYYDGENPIMNRNIILSRLYGEDTILKHIYTAVDKNDIKEFYRLKKDTAVFQTKGIFDTDDEQKKIKSFQEIKNHIEFRDLVDYSEILDELQGQLINWIYLRERDLMYFQLGFHYTCLNNRSEKPASYKTLEYKDSKKIDNAILYQICAMYINGISMYSRDKESGEVTKVGGSASTGAKIGAFLAYSNGFANECSYYTDNTICYNAGLELFENIKEHDNITELRNYIEHFRYYVAQDRSILDIYSEIFDRFFSYDMKYRKNVPNVLYNILLSHFVNVKFEFGTGKKKIGDKNGQIKERASIIIPEDGGIISEKFTYKLMDGKEITLPARGRRYLEAVATLLFYPEKVNAASAVKDLNIRERKTGGGFKGGHGKIKHM